MIITWGMKNVLLKLKYPFYEDNISYLDTYLPRKKELEAVTESASQTFPRVFWFLYPKMM